MTIHLKHRASMWHSMGQGSGSVQDDHDGTDDDGQGDDKDQPRKKYDNDPEKARLIAENKRRRQDARQWRQRAEAAESKLSGSRDDNSGSGGEGVNSAELVLAMVSAGMKPDRIKAAMKLVDFESFTDPEDAIEELREEHPFLFSGGDSEDTGNTGKMGRTAPAMNNGRTKPGRETDAEQATRLAKRFPALQRKGVLDALRGLPSRTAYAGRRGQHYVKQEASRTLRTCGLHTGFLRRSRPSRPKGLSSDGWNLLGM